MLIFLLFSRNEIETLRLNEILRCGGNWKSLDYFQTNCQRNVKLFSTSHSLCYTFLISDIDRDSGFFTVSVCHKNSKVPPTHLEYPCYRSLLFRIFKNTTNQTILLCRHYAGWLLLSHTYVLLPNPRRCNLSGWQSKGKCAKIYEQ